MKTTDQVGAELFAEIYLQVYISTSSLTEANAAATVALFDYHRATGYAEGSEGWE